MPKVKRLKRSHKTILGLLFICLVVLAGYFIFKNANFGILAPKGTIAVKQRNLIIFGSLLSLIVVLPVFFMLFYFAWKYRASNVKAKYRPDWDHSPIAETIWWTVPLALIIVLSVVTWRSSHELDPFKKIDSEVPALKVQVVALQWKWLFIYPQENVASVNHLQLPLNTPIDFEITADAPMNSFWIPQLGGQIYAMPGMTTQLHLMATQPGTYVGKSANISGEGFAGMKFETVADSQASFDQWVADSKKSYTPLSSEQYNELSEPSINDEVVRYSSYENGLYDSIVMKYMSPGHEMSGAIQMHEGSH